jgi:hypothetical protein
VPNTFLVTGIARDCEKSIRKTLKSIKSLLGSDASISYFIVESDSTDRTLKTLESTKAVEQDFHFISLGNLVGSVPDRIQRIAICRNSYLEHLDQLAKSGANPDYVVIADFDGVNNRISNIHSSTTLFSQSKVVCANQFGAYYDILALRKTGWVEEDYRLAVRRDISRGAGNIEAYIKNVSANQRKIHRTSPTIQVESAFGGLAIYPATALAGVRYTPALIGTNLYECEHVSLNSEVRNRGYDIEIQPGLQNIGAIAHTILTFRLAKVLVLTLSALKKLISW